MNQDDHFYMGLKSNLLFEKKIFGRELESLALERFFLLNVPLFYSDIIKYKLNN